jgi:hypothetical protein
LNAIGIKTVLQAIPGMITGKVVFPYDKKKLVMNPRLLTSFNAAAVFDTASISEEFLSQFDSFFADSSIIEHAFETLLKIGEHCSKFNKQFVVSLPPGDVTLHVPGLAEKLAQILVLSTAILGRENWFSL